MQRAESFLEIKSIDEDQRIIEGIASTPTTDRMGDVVDPLGVVFELPIPLHLYHDSEQPVGDVEFAKATKAGIPFRARIKKMLEPGRVRDRLDEAWHSVKAGLLKKVSIGFNPIEQERIKETGGTRFTKWEWLELSLVSIPANPQAGIIAFKATDVEQPAAHGKAAPAKSPGASGSVKLIPHKSGARPVKTISEKIKDYEATRTSKEAERDALQEKVLDEGRTKDASEREAFDAMTAEIKSLNEEIADLRVMERDNASKAKPVDGSSTEKAGASRGTPLVQVHRANLPKGTAFTRYAMALAAGKGSLSDALHYAERWKNTTPEVLNHIRGITTKAEPGTTTDDVYGWAGPLVYPNNLVSEFVGLLMPATIIGKLTGIRQVPFNVRIPVQTGGSTVNWVGEAAPKPVSQLSFDSMSLGRHKVAGIVVLTDELVKDSSPSAEEAVRRDLVAQTVRFLDAAFIDPNLTASANNPASITQGVSGSGASGTDAEALYADLNAALATFDDTDLGTGSLYILMRPSTARGISALRNALGQFEFSGLSAAGGTLMGFPVIVSNSVPSGDVILVKADEIFMADDGTVALDASNQATLDMNGGDTPDFSLWQKNCIGIRAERGMTWAKRRADAVALITGADYGPAVAS